MSAVIPRRVLLNFIRALGVRGVLFSLILVGIPLGVAWYFQRFALDCIEPLYQRHGFPSRAGGIISLLVICASLIPVLPVAMVGIFLPVRFAWIKGHAPLGELLDHSGRVFHLILATLQGSWRRGIFYLVPTVAIFILAFQAEFSTSRGYLREALLLLGSVIGIHAAWRISALACAGPLVVLIDCAPIAALSEAHLALTARYRVVAIPLLIGMVAAAVAPIPFLSFEPMRLLAAAAAAAGVIWLLGLLLAILCINATTEYLRSKGPAVRPP